MNNYPGYPNSPQQRRDPYARNSYEEQRLAEKQARREQAAANRFSSRNIIIICLVCVLCFNAVFSMYSAGMFGGMFGDLSGCAAEKEEDKPQGGFFPMTPVTSPTDTVPEPVTPAVGTAYYKIIPAEGDYASLIDRFIIYERAQMQQDDVVLTFTGDCTLGTWPSSSNETNYNAVYEKAGSPTYSFDNVKSLFLNDDYTYINLETTLTDAKTQSEQTYAFKGNPAWASEMIAPSGIEGCNIANNHHYDWLEQGYTDTINNVTAAGMDVGNEDHVIVTTCGNLEIVLISGNYIWPTGRGAVIKGEDVTNKLVDQIKQYKRENNIVIVNAHWGLERQNDANYEQFDPARAFVDAGADLVVGHHPHTLQGVEVYNGKYIFYSLGNFAFGGKASTDTVNRIAIILRPRFSVMGGVARMTGLSIVPCYTTSADDIAYNNYKPKPLVGEEAKAISDAIIDYSDHLKYGLESPLDCPTINF